MKWSAIKETLPLLLTCCAVLVIGIGVFSFSRVDAALLEPTNEPPSADLIATAPENDIQPTDTVIAPYEPRDEKEYEEVEQPTVVTVSPTNGYVTLIAIGLGIILVIGIVLIIIPSHRHGPRH